MSKYEYKVLHGKPTGSVLMPWASQKMKDEIGPGSFERKLNELAREGWTVVSCSTASMGNLVCMTPMATVLLQRPLNE